MATSSATCTDAQRNPDQSMWQGFVARSSSSGTRSIVISSCRRGRGRSRSSNRRGSSRCSGSGSSSSSSSGSRSRSTSPGTIVVVVVAVVVVVVAVVAERFAVFRCMQSAFAAF